jgi:hypothetical protein
MYRQVRVDLPSYDYSIHTACGGTYGMTARTGTWQDDDGGYGTSFTYRGNVTSRSGKPQT